MWLKDGVTFTENNPNEPFLCLHKAGIDWDSCEFSCELQKFLKCSPVVVHVSCELDKFKDSLASIYLAKPEVPKDTWPPVSNKKYINLAIIKQQKVNYGSECARLTIRGDADDIFQHKQLIDYNDIFQSFTSKLLLLIEGRPGSGKTTFVHKLAQDWAVSSGGSIRLLLLVSLRVLNTMTKPILSDILKLFTDLKVRPQLIEERDGKGVAFIFDGFDEFSPPDGEESIVYKIINKTYLSQSIVIVASRPAALTNLKTVADKTIEVLGFLNDQILEYFDYYPFSNTSKHVQLKSYVTSHPNILHMCYLPIHAAMVAFLFEVMGTVPKTETEIYLHFTRFTLMRNLSKDHTVHPRNIDISSLDGDEKHCFDHICELAFEMTLSRKQVLPQDDISSYFHACSSLDISLGLVTIDSIAGLYGFKDVYTFLHLTFQEYLAAYYVSMLSTSDQLKLIQEHGHKDHMLVVWKFYCGLVKIRPFENKFKLILQEMEGNTVFHIQCAYESQQSIACAQLLKVVNYRICLTDKYLSIPDFTGIGYVIDKSIIPVRLALLNCHLNIEAIASLLLEMRQKSLHGLHIVLETLDAAQLACVQKLLVSVGGTLKCLYVESKEYRSDFEVYYGFSGYPLNSITELSLINTDSRLLVTLSDLPFKNLERINLAGSIKGFHGVRLLVDGLKNCGNLKELNVCNNGICGECARLLAVSLKGCKNLEQLSISNNNFTCSDVINVLDSVRQCYLKVKAVEITNQHHVMCMNDEDLLVHLEGFSNLQSLEVSLDSVDRFCRGSKGWKKLKELRLTLLWYDNSSTLSVLSCFQYFKEIQTLALKYCIDSKSISHRLVSVLTQCSNLHVVDLSDNQINAKMVEVITSQLTGLQELHLNNNDLCDDGAMVLSAYLPHYRDLQQLSLGRNNISSRGCMSLAASLPHCAKLQKIDLAHNDIGDDGTCHLISSLKTCASFRSLSLSRSACYHFAQDYNNQARIKSFHFSIFFVE